MTRLIIIRHGYSVTNATKRFTGQTDVALTEEGYRQADCAAAYLAAHEKIDAVYASDLSRAVNTARPTADHFGLPIHTHRGLRELGMGIWEGMYAADVRRDYPEVLARRAEDPTYPCPEGESYAELFARVSNAIDEILAENEGRTVAVFSHGGAIRCINCKANGGSFREAPSYPGVDNASISIYNVENGRFSCELLSYTEHLKQYNAAAEKELL